MCCGLMELKALARKAEDMFGTINTKHHQKNTIPTMRHGGDFPHLKLGL